MDSYSNSYSILGLIKTDDQEIIKQGYKKMIKKYHPDKNKGNDTTAQFIKIQKAYEILSDPLKKREHDSKILIQLKKDKYTSNRKQMINDLIEKEKQSKKDQMTQNKRQRENWDNSNVNINTKQETVKLIELLQVKMNKEKAFDFSQEILSTYFKEYGIIEDIIIIHGKSNNNHLIAKTHYKALIYFKYNPKIDQIISKAITNKSISQLFEIKKKNMSMHKYCKLKSKYKGEDHIGKILFNKDESNEIQSKIKTQKMVNNIINNNDNSTHKEKGSASNINFTSISLEDFEKAVFG